MEDQSPSRDESPRTRPGEMRGTQESTRADRRNDGMIVPAGQSRVGQSDECHVINIRTSPARAEGEVRRTTAVRRRVIAVDGSSEYEGRVRTAGAGGTPATKR